MRKPLILIPSTNVDVTRGDDEMEAALRVYYTVYRAKGYSMYSLIGPVGAMLDSMRRNLVAPHMLGIGVRRHEQLGGIVNNQVLTALQTVADYLAGLHTFPPTTRTQAIERWRYWIYQHQQERLVTFKSGRLAAWSAWLTTEYTTDAELTHAWNVDRPASASRSKRVLSAPMYSRADPPYPSTSKATFTPRQKADVAAFLEFQKMQHTNDDLFEEDPNDTEIS